MNILLKDCTRGTTNHKVPFVKCNRSGEVFVATRTTITRGYSKFLYISLKTGRFHTIFLINK